MASSTLLFLKAERLVHFNKNINSIEELQTHRIVIPKSKPKVPTGISKVSDYGSLEEALAKNKKVYIDVDIYTSLNHIKNVELYGNSTIFTNEPLVLENVFIDGVHFNGQKRNREPFKLKGSFWGRWVHFSGAKTKTSEMAIVVRNEANVDVETLIVSDSQSTKKIGDGMEDRTQFISVRGWHNSNNYSEITRIRNFYVFDIGTDLEFPNGKKIDESNEQFLQEHYNTWQSGWDVDAINFSGDGENSEFYIQNLKVDRTAGTFLKSSEGSNFIQIDNIDFETNFPQKGRLLRFQKGKGRSYDGSIKYLYVKSDRRYSFNWLSKILISFGSDGHYSIEKSVFDVDLPDGALFGFDRGRGKRSLHIGSVFINGMIKDVFYSGTTFEKTKKEAVENTITLNIEEVVGNYERFFYDRGYIMNNAYAGNNCYAHKSYRFIGIDPEFIELNDSSMRQCGGWILQFE